MIIKIILRNNSHLYSIHLPLFPKRGRKLSHKSEDSLFLTTDSGESFPYPSSGAFHLDLFVSVVECLVILLWRPVCLQGNGERPR